MALSAPLASVRARTETLGRLAKEGQAAAVSKLAPDHRYELIISVQTTIEVDRVTEELEVCKVDIAKAVELVRGLVWEEIDGKAACRKRIETRIQRENPAMTADMVAMSLRQAEVGASERIAQLDVSGPQLE